MAKVAILTDTHLGFKNGNRVYLDYAEKFFQDVFFPRIHEGDISSVFHLGDLVEHRHGLSYYAASRIRNFLIKPIRNTKDKVCWNFIVGNHDIPFRESNTPNAQEFIFSEFERYEVHIYKDYDRIVLDDTDQIFVMPWVSESNMPRIKEGLKTTRKLFRKQKPWILLGHLEVKGSDMFRGVKCKKGFDISDFKDFDLVLSGHFHTRSRTGKVVYIGNTYPLYWNDYGEPRGFVILDTDTLSLEYVNNMASLFCVAAYNVETDALNVKGCDIEGRHVRLEVNGEPDPANLENVVKFINSHKPLSLQIMDRSAVKEPEKIGVSDTDSIMSVMNSYVYENVSAGRRGEVNEEIWDLYQEVQGASA